MCCCFFFTFKSWIFSLSLSHAPRENVVHTSATVIGRRVVGCFTCRLHLRSVRVNLHTTDNMFNAKSPPPMMVRCSHSRPEQKCEGSRLNRTKKNAHVPSVRQDANFSPSIFFYFFFTSARHTVRSQPPIPIIIPAVSHHPCSIRWVTVESVINTRPDHMFPALLGCCDDTSRGEG